MFSVFQVQILNVTEGADSVVLPFESKKCKRQDIKVEWKHIGDAEKTAIVHDQGGTQHQKKHRFFRRRTAMNNNPQTTGNASLTLKNLCCGDGGVYMGTIYDNGGNVLETKVVVLLVRGQY